MPIVKIMLELTLPLHDVEFENSTCRGVNLALCLVYRTLMCRANLQSTKFQGFEHVSKIHRWPINACSRGFAS